MAVSGVNLGHRHAEAYAIMRYQSDDESEVLVVWNSRDGVTPFCIGSPTTEADLTHVNWGGDVYHPLHVPEVGSWVFVDLSEERRTELVEARVKHALEQGLPEGQRDEFRQSVEADLKHGEPDLVQVDEGLRRRFQARQQAGLYAAMRAEGQPRPRDLPRGARFA